MSVLRANFGAKRALDAYRRGQELDEDDATLDEAEAAYREAIRLDPEFDFAHTNLANVLHRQGLNVQAVLHYQIALRINPRQPEASYNLGIIFHDRGETATALAMFEVALCSNELEERDDPFAADVHYRIALALDELGRPEDARPHWARCLELEPNGELGDAARKWLEIVEPKKAELRVIEGGRT